VEKGLVIKSTGSWYHVRSDGGVNVPCKIRGTYRIRGLRATNPVAVGDRVEFNFLDDSRTGVIESIAERNNYIVRKSPNLSKAYQLIACNVDQAMLMVSLVAPKTHLEFIDRFLVTAESFRIPVRLLFNKFDLYGKAEMAEWRYLQQVYSSIGYTCVETSVHTGVGIERVVELLNGRTSLLSGNSGVGKSSLLNLLDPTLRLKTSAISTAHNAGKHTTTFAEMHFLSSGARVIDTPGIKGFGMVEIDREELFHFFPEIFEASRECKFHNCLHINEPSCAVIRAVDEDRISPARYLNYLKMMEDADTKYRN
jgi:ribosome biogenesis GTPase